MVGHNMVESAILAAMIKEGILCHIDCFSMIACIHADIPITIDEMPIVKEGPKESHKGS